jgi:capsular exopolysaccharide synthesis family protein
MGRVQLPGRVVPVNEVPSNAHRGRIYFVPDADPADSFAQARWVESGDAPRIRDYWLILKKYKWRIAGCVAAAVVVATIAALMATPIYTAKSRLVIERKGPQVVNVQQVISESIESDEYNFYQSQYEMLKSRSLAADVIRELGLEKNPSFNEGGSAMGRLGGSLTGWFSGRRQGGAKDPEGVDSRLIERYGHMLEISPVKRSRLVDVAVSTADPALSAAIANAHANAFIHQGVKLRSRANEGARKFLEGKLAELKERVQNSEKTLNDFRRSKGIISLDDKENIVVDRLADLNKRLTEAEAERIGLESQARQIQQRNFDSLPAVINNPLIQNLKAQLVTLEGQEAHLAAQFKPGYPRLAQVQAQLEDVRQRLATQTKNVVEGIRSAYYASAGKEKELRRQMDEQKSAALELKDASVEYAILTREANTNKQLYDSVFERIKEVGLAAEIPASNISVLDRAEVPLLPSAPQKRLMVMLAAIFGFMAGAGWALLAEHWDDTLRTPADVERDLGLTNLVIVPDFFSLPKQPAEWRLPFTGRRVSADAQICMPNKSPVPANLRFTVITEAYRKLRTAILYSRPGQAPKSILFTSSTAGEGKTISVTNTAIMFSRSNYNCLVIDADLRRPHCHRALRVSNDRGLTDFLVGQERLDAVIKTTSVTNLSVLNCGAAAPNPAELLGSQKMRDLLEELKRRFDFIFIDSPPVMPVSDAVMLANLVEAVVFVVRGQATPKKWVQDALGELRRERAKLLGVVLNRIDLRSGDYENHYQYYDGEYYSSLRLT